MQEIIKLQAMQEIIKLCVCIIDIVCMCGVGGYS